jgi:hypothetical protein
MRPVRLPVVASALACLALLPAIAAALSHPCASVVEPADRLECYDKAFPPAEGVRTTALDREARRQEALRDFGLSKVQKAERDPDQYEAGPERIEATVAKVTYRATGERVVTLDNGQVWLLTEVTDKGWLKAGDRITMKTAALGTFMLDTGRILLRARRLQ